jgi:hypothetical protein
MPIGAPIHHPIVPPRVVVTRRMSFTARGV